MTASSLEGRADAHVSATRNRDTGAQRGERLGGESTGYHMVRGKEKLILVTWATLQLVEMKSSELLLNSSGLRSSQDP